jgi:hypothetical protein
MKKNRKKLSRAEALALVTVAPKVALDAQETHSTYSTSGLKAFQHKYEGEQEEAREAPLRAAKGEHSRLLTQLVEQDIPTLYSAPSTYLEATAPSVGTGDQFNGISPESIRATIRKAFSEFEDSLSEGKLTMSGKQKMQNVARANLNIDTTQAAAWQQIFTLLRTSGEILDQGDSDQPDFIVNEIQEEPEQRESLTQTLDANSTFDRTGRKAIADSMMGDMQDEAAKAFQIFNASIEREFNYSFSDSDTQSLIEVMKQRNLLFTSQKAWSEAKLVCIKRGLLPRSLMSKQELFDEMIENADTQSYAGRQELKRQERLLLGR